MQKFSHGLHLRSCTCIGGHQASTRTTHNLSFFASTQEHINAAGVTPRRFVCRAAATTRFRTDEVAERLLNAQAKAARLFDDIQSRGLFAPGRTESQISEAIFDLAAEEHGTRQHWHSRIVRIGENTKLVYGTDGPDRALAEDDIAFADLGPVFEHAEADFGRTWVVGEDQEKRDLAAALPRVFETCKRQYLAQPDITGAEFYALVVRECETEGYSYGNPAFCGHLVGEFPHERVLGDGAVNYIAPDNHVPMSEPAENGLSRHWILEIHLIHASGGFGGFLEELLTL